MEQPIHGGKNSTGAEKKETTETFRLAGAAAEPIVCRMRARRGKASKSMAGLGAAAWLWTLAAAGQAVSTPVRATWTEDPATTATIGWDAPAEGRGEVRYGATTNYDAVARDGGGLRHHAIPLRGLEPGTRYFYEAARRMDFAKPPRS
jgi:hypothetical protein